MSGGPPQASGKGPKRIEDFESMSEESVKKLAQHFTSSGYLQMVMNAAEPDVREAKVSMTKLKLEGLQPIDSKRDFEMAGGTKEVADKPYIFVVNCDEVEALLFARNTFSSDQIVVLNSCDSRHPGGGMFLGAAGPEAKLLMRTSIFQNLGLNRDQVQKFRDADKLSYRVGKKTSKPIKTEEGTEKAPVTGSAGGPYPLAWDDLVYIRNTTFLMRQVNDGNPRANWYNADVICCAPEEDFAESQSRGFKRGTKNFPGYADEQPRTRLRAQIKGILRAAIANQANTVILTAHGNFVGHPKYEIAEVMASVLTCQAEEDREDWKAGGIDNIIVAVWDWVKQEKPYNLWHAFVDMFDGKPGVRVDLGGELLGRQFGLTPYDQDD